MPLANPIVSRLAAGDSCDGEVCGLLLVMNWPASCIVQGKLDVFKEAVLPAAAYLYPPSSLHCTVATLRAFTGGPLTSADNGARQTEAARWAAVLDAAAAAPSWPSGPITLRMLAPQFEGAAGIIRYEEVSPGGKVELVQNIGVHYVPTLAQWRRNFMENKHKLLALGFDDVFIRKWEYYFHYCEVGFAMRALTVETFRSHPKLHPGPDHDLMQVGFAMRVLGDLQIVYSKAANQDLTTPIEHSLVERSRGLDTFIDTNGAAVRNGH